MNYPQRLDQLRQHMAADGIDLVFLPISADLQYIASIPRDMPNFGTTIYPGQWLEGAFIGQSGEPIVTLPRMTAEFHLQGVVAGDVRVLQDRDDPFALVKDVLAAFNLNSAAPRVALGNRAYAETVVALARLLPSAIFSNAADLIRPLRQIKSVDEIDVMRRAGAVTEAAFTDVLARLKHGMTETEISAEVDLQLRRHGAIGPSFTTSMYNCGPNHNVSLGHANTQRNQPLTAPIALLFDFGAAFEGYCYDFGRTVFFGEPDAEMRNIYETIMTAQATGIRALRAGGASCQDVDRAARAVVEAAGYGAYFRHRLGHGIGMDVHEPPFLIEGDATPLQDGMAFTIEPSILTPHGFGARVEDIIIARPHGGEPLTTGFQSLIVI